MNENSNLHRKPKKRSEMSDDERVRDFQRKIYLKAKQEKKARFYVLYDKIRLKHFLREAYKRVKANKGAAGIDGMTFEDIEERGTTGFLEEIRIELENKTYKPSPVKRVMIPKTNGKMRALGIPTIRDRVAQMSCKMVIEPIFEADFEDSSYGFRPKRSTSDAVKKVKQHLDKGKVEVYDADLSKYFDTIPHNKLLNIVAMRISDKNVLHLIKMWLKAPVIDKDNKHGGGKKNKVGTPQGGVISPLLANIYLHLLDDYVNNAKSAFRYYGVSIVRYADDFLLMAKEMKSEVLVLLNKILDKAKLGVNKEKSKLINVYYQPLEYLGFCFRFDRDIYGRDKRYLNVIPSEKSLGKVKKNIREYLDKAGHLPPDLVARDINRITCGWINYFSIRKISYPGTAKRKLRYYLAKKLNRYYKRKSQRKSKLHGNGAFGKLVSKYGLIDPCSYGNV